MKYQNLNLSDGCQQIERKGSKQVEKKHSKDMDKQGCG